jgi:hypothetical protein
LGGWIGFRGRGIGEEAGGGGGAGRHGVSVPKTGSKD